MDPSPVTTPASLDQDHLLPRVHLAYVAQSTVELGGDFEAVNPAPTTTAARRPGPVRAAIAVAEPRQVGVQGRRAGHESRRRTCTRHRAALAGPRRLPVASTKRS